MGERIMVQDHELVRKYLNENIKNTIFVNRHCQYRTLWKPEPLRMTGKIPIADTIEDIYR